MNFPNTANESAKRRGEWRLWTDLNEPTSGAILEARASAGSMSPITHSISCAAAVRLDRRRGFSMLLTIDLPLDWRVKPNVSCTLRTAGRVRFACPAVDLRVRRVLSVPRQDERIRAAR